MSTLRNSGERRYYRWLISLTVILTAAFLAPLASAYNFTFFGGRLGRDGVATGAAGTNDFLYSWPTPDNGTLTWWLDRNAPPGGNGLPVANCDAACLAALKARVQPELDKWALWIRVSFSEAANMAAADVVIRFTTDSATADADADGNTGTTLDNALIRINPGLQPNWTTAAA